MPGRYTATPSASVVLSPNNRFTGFHGADDESAYSLSPDLGVTVADMGIAQHRGEVGMSQHSCDRRKRDNLTSDRVSKIMAADILNTRLSACAFSMGTPLRITSRVWRSAYERSSV